MGVDEVPDLSQTTSSIGVISDTHGHIVNTRRAVRMFESMQVQQVLHCGDIGSPEIPPLFDAWPTHYVLGNVDGGGGGGAAGVDPGSGRYLLWAIWGPDDRPPTDCPFAWR